MRSTNKLFALTGAMLLVMLTFGPAAAGAVSTANGNESGNADAGNAEGNFGMQVSDFVHDLMDEEIDDNETFGTVVADFVLANNPAADKIPDHAGPPDHAGNAGNAEQGPPDDAGAGNAGPPEDAGPSGDDDDEEADEEDEDDQGPPEGAGPPGNGN